MMQAAWYEKNGPADQVLQVGQQPVPQADAGQVRVRLACSGVNPSDVKSRAGGRPVRWNLIIPHSDGAGIIDQVGQGVDAGRVGERVWLWNAQYNRAHGTAAEYIVLPAEQAVELPENVSFEAGACMGIPALTAFRAVELAQIEPEQTVLVIGGASGVGYYAVQMAQAQGARVITTVGSQTKAAFLHESGVHDTILYKEESVADRVLAMTDGAGVNAIIDMDLSTTIALVDAHVLAQHGRLVCYGSNERGVVPLNYGQWLPRSLSLHFFLVYELTHAQRLRALDGVQAMLRKGLLEHHIGPTYPLADVVLAHQAVESGTSLGNVIVNCGGG
ncbi:alcohol dehydrogenase [Advenella kashmirensis WT001]|uniref:Alcohol dehydrogenase n=1 Tax=Advenella kashmirensis (strain DSM 17095 / LMG 22695 / WT001) TaxID=1036672 RepID=I3UG95_ADVKW|nr:NADPH:quinone reductase [Advenella kashmirensis]AFK64033.1 alcohol dehydrogenase [Advenella kashmirensis WT001]